MAGIGILLANILLIFILLLAIIGAVLFIISMVLFFKYKKKKKEGKNNIKKVGAIITLVISIILFLPLIITIFSISIRSQIDDNNTKKIIDAIENKVIVKKDEWKNGFEYDGKKLIPVNLLMNSDNYKTWGTLKNLNKIGALVIKNTNSYYYLYDLDNDIGCKIYYVLVETFTDGEYYTRTFVDENDYKTVLNYYSKTNLNVKVLWRTAPQYTKLNNTWTSLELNISGKQNELVKLSKEVLNNVSNKKQKTILYSKEYDNIMKFEIRSDDRVFTIDLHMYTKGDDMKLYLNGFEVEEKIIKKYKDMLISLMNDSKTELLLK